MASSGVISTTIPANTSISGGVDLGNFNAYALEFDANFNATTVSFQAKSKTMEEDEELDVGEPNPEQWKNVYGTDGSEITYTVAKSRIVMLPSTFAALRYVRVRAGTAGVPVNIPGSTIKFICKEN